MNLKSNSLHEGARIPEKFTSDGADRSPHLRWDDVPENVKEFALIVDDPDAPSIHPWVHWIAYGIPANVRELPEGIPRKSEIQTPVKLKQGVNSWGANSVGYRGPAPPSGHGVHHYHFKLYALNAELSLAAGSSKEKLLTAMKGHILAEAKLLGTYSR